VIAWAPMACGGLLAVALLSRWPGPVGTAGRLSRVAAGIPRPFTGARTRRARLRAVIRSVRTLHGRARRRERTSAAADDFLSAVSAHLAVGASPEAAIEQAADEVTDPVLSGVVARIGDAVRIGSDPPEAMITGSGAAGCEVLRWCAAAWRVAETSGASLATSIDSVVATARAERAHRRSVATALAGPRATARLLALLPVGGVALGTLLGARPLRVLTETSAGWALLFAGAGLQAAGLRWTVALVRSAERM
jgi:tight adherence protein B